jgi:hypothetical protein
MKMPSNGGTVLLFLLVILGQSHAVSCPVCFGALDDPATNGMNVAIFTLLGVTGSVLGAFVAFFLRLRKLSRSAATERGEG